MSTAITTTATQATIELPATDAPLLDWALYWAGEHGVPVFPLGDRRTPGTLPAGRNDFSKTPRGKCGECKASSKTGRFCYAECGHRLCHGVLGASTDPDQIRAWWAKYPRANIGGAMGPDAGLLVIEADVAHEFKDADGKVLRVVDGREALATEIAANAGEWPATWTNLSGSDGPHYLFAYPDRPRSDGKPWGNGVGGENANKVAEGVDVRGGGGYIVLPPSSSNKGAYRIQHAIRPAQPPGWALARIDKQAAPRRTAPAPGVYSAKPFASTGDRVQDAARAMFNAAVGKLATTTSGRNHALNLAAYAVAGLVWHQDSGITEQEGRDAVWDAAVSNGYVAKDGEAAARASFDSGWENGLAHPAPWPPEDRPFTPDPNHISAELRNAVAVSIDDGWEAEEITIMLTDEQATVLDVVGRIARRNGEDVTSTVVTPVAAEPAPTVTKPRGLPPIPYERVTIPMQNRPVRDIRADMVDALRRSNLAEPRLFLHGSDLVIAGKGKLAALGTASLALEWSEVADFVVPSTESKGERKKVRAANEKRAKAAKDTAVELDELPDLDWSHVEPHPMIVKAALETPGELGLPEVDRVAHTPFFAADGTLQAEPGYHRDARIIYVRTPGVVVPPIPENPTTWEVDAAKHLLMDQMLGDFPFDSRADLAGLMAVGITIVARNMIDGPAPLALISAPTEGTGKGMALEMVVGPLSGRTFTVSPAPTSVDEWHKSIVAALRPGPVVATFDNVSSDLDSGPLASAITGWPMIASRVLGVSETVELPPPCMFVATGNNVITSAEMARRIVRVHLDSKTSNPSERDDFAIDNLRRWVGEREGEIIAAWLTLVQSWVAAGMPKAKTPKMGSFESWIEVVGSILDHVGILGLLENRGQQVAAMDEETATRERFITGWLADPGEIEIAGLDDGDRPMAEARDSCKGQKCTSKQLIEMIEARDYDYPIDLGNGSLKSRSTRFGKWISKLEGKRVGPGGAYVVVKGTLDGCATYELVHDPA